MKPFQLRKSEKHNYFIDSADLDDAFKVSVVISATLKKNLVLCNENWFMIGNDNLWKKEKEPSYYIINELRKYIDYSNKVIVNAISHKHGEEKEKLIEKSKVYLKTYKTSSGIGFLSVLIKYLKSLLVDNKFESKLDANKGKLAFKNGIVDLETKTFRLGIKPDDYIPKTIPYDYNTKVDKSKAIFVKNTLKKILNNNDEHLEYFLSVVGYTFIGLPNLEKSIYFCVDKTTKASGDNGKTFFFDILTHLMPNYVYKSKASFLEDGNSKVHKQLSMMKGMRLVWLDEFGKKKSNSELIKELGDGLTTENEVMFGTSEIVNIMFKLFALTNNIPVIDPKDTAVFNRYKQISYGSHFDRTGTRQKEDPVNLLFIADTKLGDIIKTQYYDGVFDLIIEYANKYFVTKKALPPIPTDFMRGALETQLNNDRFGSWFHENCEIDANERVALRVLLAHCQMSEKEVKEGMARMGFKYNKELKGMGKDDDGKYYKGGFSGVKFIEKDEEDESKTDDEEELRNAVYSLI